MNQIPFKVLVAWFIAWTLTLRAEPLTSAGPWLLPIVRSHINLRTRKPFVRLLFGLYFQEGIQCEGEVIPAGRRITSVYSEWIARDSSGNPVLRSCTPNYGIPFRSVATHQWVPQHRGTPVRKLLFDPGTNMYSVFFWREPDSLRKYYDGSSGKIIRSLERTRQFDYSYNALGYLTKVTDPFGNKIEFDYELPYGSGFILSRIRTRGKTYETEYSNYHPAGNTNLMIRTIRTDCGSGRVPILVTAGPVRGTIIGALGGLFLGLEGKGVGFEYQGNGEIFRVQPETLAPSGRTSTDPGVSFAFESNRARITDLEGTTTYTFGNAPLFPLLSIADSKTTVSYTYPEGATDSLPQSQNITINPTTDVSHKPSSYSQEYEWSDESGLLNSVTSGGSGSLERRFNSIGQLEQESRLGGRNLTLTYHPNGQVSQLSYGNHSEIYGIDENGYVNSVTKDGVNVYRSENSALGLPLSATIDGREITRRYENGVQGYLGYPIFLSDGKRQKAVTITSTPTHTTFVTTSQLGDGNPAIVETTIINSCMVEPVSYTNTLGVSHSVSMDVPDSQHNRTTTTSSLGTGYRDTVQRAVPGSAASYKYLSQAPGGTEAEVAMCTEYPNTSGSGGASSGSGGGGSSGSGGGSGSASNQGGSCIQAELLCSLGSQCCSRTCTNFRCEPERGGGRGGSGGSTTPAPPICIPNGERCGSNRVCCSGSCCNSFCATTCGGGGTGIPTPSAPGSGTAR